MRTPVLLATVFVVGLPLAAATVEIDETRPLKPGGKLEIEIVSGSVQISGWDRDEVHIRGTIDERFTGIDIDGSGSSVSIEVEPIRDSHRKDRNVTDLVVTVPRSCDLEIESISAGFTIDKIDGDIEIESVSGRVEISGGDLEVAVSTVSGAVTVRAAGSLLGGDFESVSGNVEIHAPLAPGGRFSFETVNGDVELYLPADTSARFDVETFSGDVVNDFGAKAEKTSIYLPAKELRFSIGSGDAKVGIETMNGDIRLVKE